MWLDKLYGSVILSQFQTDDRVQDVEKNVTDQEQRYLKYICKSSAILNYICAFYAAKNGS